jgi:hypothetical protein
MILTKNTPTDTLTYNDLAMLIASNPKYLNFVVECKCKNIPHELWTREHAIWDKAYLEISNLNGNKHTCNIGSITLLEWIKQHLDYAYATVHIFKTKKEYYTFLASKVED